MGSRFRDELDPLQELADSEDRDTGVLALTKELGVALWQDEEQRFFPFKTDQVLPDRFEHVVTGQDGDRGMRYQYRWIEIAPTLGQSLVQGSNAFVGAMIVALE